MKRRFFNIAVSVVVAAFSFIALAEDENPVSEAAGVAGKVADVGSIGVQKQIAEEAKAAKAAIAEATDSLSKGYAATAGENLDVALKHADNAKALKAGGDALTIVSLGAEFVEGGVNIANAPEGQKAEAVSVMSARVAGAASGALLGDAVGGVPGAVVGTVAGAVFPEAAENGIKYLNEHPEINPGAQSVNAVYDSPIGSAVSEATAEAWYYIRNGPQGALNDETWAAIQAMKDNSSSALTSDAVLNNLNIDDFGGDIVDDTVEFADRMLEKWESKINEMSAALGDEDKSVIAQAIETVREKIAEAVEKGEKWVEEGGIRETIKEKLDKALDGKVSEADKARALNLADKLCDINKDGGRAFAEALGTDGADLLESLAVKKIQQEISKALPKDVADNLNTYIQMLTLDNTAFSDPAAKQQLLDTVKAAIKEYVPYEYSAETINGLLQDIYDGKSGDVLDSAKDLAKSITADALKDAITKNMDPAVAGPLLAAIDGYMQNGGLEGALDGGLEALIDQYAPGEESKQMLKDALVKIKDGSITAADMKKVTSTVFADKMKSVIDGSNLSPEAKNAAKNAVDILKDNGISGMTTAAETFIHDYVEGKLGPEAGEAAANIFNAIVTPGEDVWTAVDKNLPTLVGAAGTKLLSQVEGKMVKQLDAFIQSNPALAKICGILGIDGQGVVNSLKNVFGVLQNAASLGEAFAKIGQMVVDGLKQMLANAIKWGFEQLGAMLNNLIDRAIDALTKKIGDWAGKVDNALIKKALEWVQSQADKVLKAGAQKVVCKICTRATVWTTGKLGLPDPTKKKEDQQGGGTVTKQQIGKQKKP